MFVVLVKGMVFVLVLVDCVIDESFDIMCWVFGWYDLEGWFDCDDFVLIVCNDGVFKYYFDCYKYFEWYDGDLGVYCVEGLVIFVDLDVCLMVLVNLCGDVLGFVDIVIMLFVC